MEELPKKSAGREVTETTAEALASAIPVVGGPLGVVLATVLGLQFERRRDAWLNDLAASVAALEARGEGRTFEQLAEDDGFVDVVVQATRAAQATSREEKVEALRNGVLNSLEPDAPSLDEQSRFIRLVDEFTPTHLTVLMILGDPSRAIQTREAADWGSSSSLGGLLEHLEPTLRGQREWYDLVVSDLDGAGLSSAASALHAMMTPAGVLSPRATGLGQRFLSFIQSPPAVTRPIEPLADARRAPGEPT